MRAAVAWPSAVVLAAGLLSDVGHRGAWRCRGLSPQGAAQAGGDAAVGAAIGESPADLALRLEALLGQHPVRVSDMMRSRIRNDEDFVQALGKLSVALAPAAMVLAAVAAVLTTYLRRPAPWQAWR
jgi:hypothetical protein